jgi:hypothetical protein
MFVKLTGLDGRELGAVRWTDDVCITYGFRIDQPGVSIRATCDVFARGVLAFRTLQPEEVAIADPGTYTASVRIPRGLLAETIYSVNAAIDVRTPAGEHRPIADRNALSFRVYDAAKHSMHGTWRGGMPGVIAPALEWQFAAERREADVNV